MFDAEKRTLELLLKGNRVSHYIHTNYVYNIDTVWYIHGGVAFRPYQDFIKSDLFSSYGNKFFDSWARVVNWYRDNPHFFMTAQKPLDHDKTKLIPMLCTGEDEKLLKYVPYADIKPWLGKKWRYVFVPEEYSWKGGVFLVLREDHPLPEAFVLPFRKDD